jgi:hypothetical protein
MRSLHAPESVPMFVAEDTAVVRLEEGWEPDDPARIDRPDLAEASLISCLLTAREGALLSVARHRWRIAADHATHTAKRVEDAVHTSPFMK